MTLNYTNSTSGSETEQGGSPTPPESIHGRAFTAQLSRRISFAAGTHVATGGRDSIVGGGKRQLRAESSNPASNFYSDGWDRSQGIKPRITPAPEEWEHVRVILDSVKDMSDNDATDHLYKVCIGEIGPSNADSVWTFKKCMGVPQQSSEGSTWKPCEEDAKSLSKYCQDVVKEIRSGQQRERDREEHIDRRVEVYRNQLEQSGQASR